MATSMWRRLVPRWWVAALLLILLITAAALAWNALPASPHTYSATRTLRIAVLPADGAGAYGASVAQTTEAAIARELAASSMLSSPAYTAAVIGQLNDLSPSPTPGGHPSAAHVGQALSAGYTGSAVTLTALWDNADGATALADAAMRALAADAIVSTLPDGASLRMVVEGVGEPARLDAGAQTARSMEILQRGGLAALAVVIVAGALTALEMTGQRGESGRGHAAEASARGLTGGSAQS